MRRRRSQIEGDVRLGRGVELGEGCRLLAIGGPIVIGDATLLGDRCRLVAHAGIEIGRDCRLGDGVVVLDFEPVHEDADRPIRFQGLRASPVRVADRATLGPMACLGPGARVGAGEVVGPHVVVDPSRPVPARGPAPPA